jgi:transcriptional regulator with XRE-family HTH domain
MKINDDFNLKDWFDKEVDQLRDDPEFIANKLMVHLASQVAVKLEKEGLKQKDLANKLNKSESWISRFMNDPTNFSVKKLVEIAVVLGMKLEINFSDSNAFSTNQPKTISGEPKRRPTRQLSFEDISQSKKMEKVSQSNNNNIAA